MMQKTVFSIILALVLISCKERGAREVERLTMTSAHIVSDSIETMMPGIMYVAGKYILWTDPFHSDRFVHVLDANTGKEISTIIEKGEGPGQFVTPDLALIGQDKLFLYDRNSERKGLFSIEKAINKENPFVESVKKDMKGATQMLAAKNEELILFYPDKSEPFILEKNGQRTAFGKLPVEEVTNGYNVFQGAVAYYPDKDKLIYATSGIPYMAIYKRCGDSFCLENESLRNTNYSINNGEFVYKEQEQGAKGMALLKDYIVTLERDRTIDDTDESKVGRDFTKLPQTVFLYDYKLNLRKIIHLGMPVIRIAADPSTNTLYVIGVNPDFMLMKYEL